ncbi:hypothetical protein MMPV_007937 [Pyropia vietnamensis]
MAFAVATPLGRRSSAVTGIPLFRPASAGVFPATARHAVVVPPRAAAAAAEEGNTSPPVVVSRRSVLSTAAAAVAGAVLGATRGVTPPPPAAARSGLPLFPLAEPLVNRYVFMRAAESAVAVEGVTATNPAERLSAALHGLTPRGRETVAAAVAHLAENLDVSSDAWIYADVGAGAYETATHLAEGLGVRPERLIPEFAYLEARGVGALNGAPTEAVATALAEGEAAGGIGWRPDPAEDGTPNESLEEVFVRGRQWLAKMETQYFCDTIVVVAPDSSVLQVLEAVLRAAPGGVADHTAYAYAPGEAREVVPVVVPPQEKPRVGLADALRTYTATTEQ